MGLDGGVVDVDDGAGTGGGRGGEIRRLAAVVVGLRLVDALGVEQRRALGEEGQHSPARQQRRRHERRGGSGRGCAEVPRDGGEAAARGCHRAGALGCRGQCAAQLRAKRRVGVALLMSDA